MYTEVEFSEKYNKDNRIYNLKGFSPATVDQAYLAALGVDVLPSQTVTEKLRTGSELFMERLASRTLFPEPRYRILMADVEKDFEVHNYTGRCPTLTYEINPVQGCHLGCLYCLVTDGEHQQPLTLYANYDEAVARMLARHRQGQHYFYFSPKTEAFQEPTLQSGLAHRILRAFVDHYETWPDSGARLFIASKAGAGELLHEYEGESILDLFEQLKGRMQFNTSLSIMPPVLRDLIEPNTPPVEDRLAAVAMCRERGVMANSALIQPILPVGLTREYLQDYFRSLHEVGVINYKPEFLTLCPENLAMIGQLLGYVDKDLERALYSVYIEPGNEDHVKQRSRTAPLRELSRALLDTMMEITGSLSMSVSICYWVRNELELSEEYIPLINENGFQCLGYQSGLFEG